MNSILDKLNKRKKPGIIKKFPLQIDDKINIDYPVLVKLLYQHELDMCKIKAETYIDQIKFKNPEVEIIDCISIECIVHSFYDPETNEKIFNSANEIRKNMTSEEIAQCVMLYNSVAWELSTKDEVNRETALMLAKKLAQEGDKDAIELLTSYDLKQLVVLLSKELEKIKIHNNNNNTQEEVTP
jgi:hypothetical protein